MEQSRSILSDSRAREPQFLSVNGSSSENKNGAHDPNAIVGQNDAVKFVLFKAEQVASSDTAVTLLSETGVGKRLVARAIHQLSPRRARPLIKVNCAALPANIIESELFGKGAFSGEIGFRGGPFRTVPTAATRLETKRLLAWGQKPDDRKAIS
ncbi:MAG TPA: sigma 54-interacting transcriptional regulator [Candidatus Binatia bacterium]|jgi:transcriptional regulator with GAF, ATPase, and Fis domain